MTKKKRIFSGCLAILLLGSLCFTSACANSSKEASVQLQITDSNPNDFPPYPSVAEAMGSLAANDQADRRVPGGNTGFESVYADFALAREKGLIGSDDSYSDTYLKLQAVYREAFNTLINQNGALSKVDTELAQAPEKYVPASSQQWNIYQRYGSFGRKYIYLDNDFYIEQLNHDDLELLANPTPQNMPAIIQMVKRTYVSVVTMRDRLHPEVTGVMRNNDHSHGAKCDAVVLVIHYTGSLDANATFKQLTAADNKAKTIAKSLEKELKAEFGGDFTVFVDTI
jgi:hypothetical protein